MITHTHTHTHTQAEEGADRSRAAPKESAMQRKAQQKKKGNSTCFY
jgi:hypothetical protein